MGEAMKEPYGDSLIDDSNRRLYTALGREFTGRVLSSLIRQPFQTASELARELSIHIATAQKYLEELRGLGLVSSRLRKAPTRHVDEYYLTFKRLELTLDTGDAESTRRDGAAALSSLMVKESANQSVAFDVDHKEKRVTRALFLGGGARKSVSGSLELSDIEGRMLWHMPFPSEEARPVSDILGQAGLANLDRDAALVAVHHLRRVGLIEISTVEVE